MRLSLYDHYQILYYHILCDIWIIGDRRWLLSRSQKINSNLQLFVPNQHPRQEATGPPERCLVAIVRGSDHPAHWRYNCLSFTCSSILQQTMKYDEMIKDCLKKCIRDGYSSIQPLHKILNEVAAQLFNRTSASSEGPVTNLPISS